MAATQQQDQALPARHDRPPSPSPPPPSSSTASWFSQAITLLLNNPRRCIHSLKVALALSLVSTTVLQQDLFNRFGTNAIWAVMTVVVVFELTAGATLCKGINRAFGTLLAGTLALGVEYLADLAGPRGEPYVVGASVFIVGISYRSVLEEKNRICLLSWIRPASRWVNCSQFKDFGVDVMVMYYDGMNTIAGVIATFVRFCEPFKSRFDYGVMVFILTFSLIIVSGYRVSDNLGMAVSRFLTIVLGGAVCLVINLLIYPIWAGEDLHNIIANNFISLGQALEDCIKVYFKGPMIHVDSNEEDLVYKCYKEVLLSKPSQESLANFALWEPRICCSINQKSVWKQYVEVGGMLHSCAYTVASLHGCLTSNVLAPLCLRKVFSNQCLSIALQSSSLVKELGENINRRERTRPKEDMMGSLCRKVEKLKHDINAYPHHYIHLQRWALVKVSRSSSFSHLDEELPIGHETNPQSMFLHDSIHNNSFQSINNVAKLANDFNNESFENLERVYDVGREERGSLIDFLSIATIAFLLIDLVPKLGHLVDSVKSLEKMASFSKGTRDKIAMDKSCYDSITIQMAE